MDIERISSDGLTREAWTLGATLEDGVKGRLRVQVVYYLRQMRKNKRGKWQTEAYWMLRGGASGDPRRLSSVPRIEDDEIHNAIWNRMVVEWPEGTSDR